MRVNAVPNGESKQRAVVVFGASMEEVREWRLFFFFLSVKSYRPLQSSRNNSLRNSQELNVPENII